MATAMSDEHVRRETRRAIGRRIRELRERFGLSQAELARLLGLSQVVTVSRWERGVALPSADLRVKLARLFSVEMADLFGELYGSDTAATELWARDILAMVRAAGGSTTDPAERRRRQADLLRALIQARRQSGDSVPEFVYALLGRLESGDDV